MRRSTVWLAAGAFSLALAAGCVGDDPLLGDDGLTPDGGASSSSGASGSGDDGGGSSSSGDAQLPNDSDAGGDASLCGTPVGTLVHLEGDGFNGRFNDVAALPNGDSVAVGEFRGATAFGDAGAPAGDALDSAFVVRRREDGSVIWQRSLGGAENDAFYAVATDEAGDIYAAGEFDSATFSIDAALTVSGSATDSGVVVKLAGSDGHAIWAHAYTPGAFGTGCSRIAARAGRVTLACSMGATQAYFGPAHAGATLTSSTPWAMALYGLDPASGDANWALAMRSTSSEDPQYKGVDFSSVELDAEGQTLISGTFTGDSFQDTKAILSAPLVGPEANGFVLVVNKLGVPDWMKTFGLANTTGQIAGVESVRATFVGGNVLMGSNFRDGQIDLGTGPRATVGGSDVVLALLANKGGAPAWVEYLAGTGNDQLAGFATDDCGRPALSFRAESELIYQGTHLPAPQVGSFVSVTGKLDATTGALYWFKGVSPGDDPDSNGLNVNTIRTVHGRTVVAGSFRGIMSFGSEFAPIQKRDEDSTNPFWATYEP